MKVKYIALAILAIFGFGGCDEEYAKIPLEVPVDFFQKGAVYETNFQAPWNIWGSRVRFDMMVRTPDLRFANEEEKKLSRYVFQGHPEGITPYFKVKITLTPLGWASHEIPIIFGELDNRKEKLYTNEQMIEEIVSVPLYGYGYGKTIMIADLQRLRNYHVRVESLEDVNMTKGLSTSFIIGIYDRKH